MDELAYLEMPKRPTLDDLILFFHAKPGVDYLICKLENQIKATKSGEGWRVLPGAPYAKVGDHDCILMYRGEIIPGTSEQTCVPRFLFDPQLPEEYFVEPAAQGQPNGAQRQNGRK